MNHAVTKIISHEFSPKRLTSTFAFGFPAAVAVKQIADTIQAIEHHAEHVLGLDGFLAGTAAEEILYDVTEAALITAAGVAWYLSAPLRHWAGLKMASAVGAILLSLSPLPAVQDNRPQTEMAQMLRLNDHVSLHYKF